LARFYAVAALVVCSYLTLLSLWIVRLEHSPADKVGFGVLWLGILVILLMLGGLVWIMWHFGQGGSRLESDTIEAPLTEGLADNDRWLLGMIYVNRDDPSVLIESRFGIGYTLNFGNRLAILVAAAFLLLALGLIALLTGRWLLAP
jgi:uncharacterized membrane protein